MRFGSVCSGIEAASVAWNPLGWEAAWLSEIEPFPSAVLAQHYPGVPNLGDMTTLPDRIRSGEVEAPDLFCGGTPCQAFSVAGLRKSLEDARGNLSLTFCEIANAIDHVRGLRGQQPTIVFWENVPGVLSTKDNAFGCFLGALAGEDCELKPPGKRWADAGCVFGPQRAIAWRVLDAQYFGVAQRRRRVFVVASARDGFDPATVLFEFDGVRRDSAPSLEAREGTACGAVQGAVLRCGCGYRFDVSLGAYGCPNCEGDRGPAKEDAGRTMTMAHGQGGAEIAEDRAPTLTCNHEAPIAAYGIRTANTSSNGWGIQEEATHTLDQAMGIAVAHSLRGEGFDASEDGTGRGTQLAPHVVGALACNTGPNGHDAGNFACNQAVDAGHVLPVAVAFHPTQDPISSTDGSTHALSCGSTGGQASVAVALRGREGGAVAELGDEVQNCLRASGGGGDKPHVLIPAIAFSEIAACRLSATGAGFLTGNEQMSIEQNVAGVNTPSGLKVRRLTPEECEALQGFPRGYTAIPWRKKPASECPDGLRYKALGNSWAVPVVRWIGERIAGYMAANDNRPQGQETA